MAIKVTAEDEQYPGEHDQKTIWNDYCLITAGSCEVGHINVYRKKDGSSTHVITVKGVRR